MDLAEQLDEFADGYVTLGRLVDDHVDEVGHSTVEDPTPVLVIVGELAVQGLRWTVDGWTVEEPFDRPGDMTATDETWPTFRSAASSSRDEAQDGP